MMICFCTYLVRDELVVWRPRLGLASRNEVGSWAPDGVFDEVGDEDREDE